MLQSQMVLRRGVDIMRTMTIWGRVGTPSRWCRTHLPLSTDPTTCTCRRMRPACPLQSSPVVNDIEGCGMKRHACVMPTVRIH